MNQSNAQKVGIILSPVLKMVVKVVKILFSCCFCIVAAALSSVLQALKDILLFLYYYENVIGILGNIKNFKTPQNFSFAGNN